MTIYLPWVRTGLIGAVDTADSLTGPLPTRAEFTVTTAVGQGEGESGSLRLRVNGPGEVLSLDRRLVIRTEPADGAGEAEPNYFCSVEFSVPDLPWLFTPAGPNGDRLRPWFVLVVVAEDAARLDVGDGRRPDVLHVADVRAELPDLSQSHAWAHAQADALTELGSAAAHPLSRLVCPRLLRERTRYVAAVVPAFEVGRLAGLGLPVPEAVTTIPAWDTTVAAALDLPVFYSWRFTTGLDGDFESLVSRLRRTSLGGDTAAGREAAVTDLPGGLPDLAGWRFPGALGLCPDPFPGNAFEDVLTQLVDGDRTVAGLPVPPPLYGRWHAAAGALAGTAKPWLRRLNVDPRYRSAAALGTRLVQDHQEALMVAAWQQIGAVEAANALLRQSQLARIASTVVHGMLSGLDAATLLQLTRPLHTRVLHPASGQTVAVRVDTSRVPAAMTSAAFRRALRPRGPLGVRAGVPAADLLRQVNEGTPVVPPRPAPDGMVSVDEKIGPDVTRWCDITAASIRGERDKPVKVTAELWRALIDAAVAQQKGMPPCPPPKPLPPRRPRLPLDGVQGIRQVLLDATLPAHTIKARVADRVTGPPGWAPEDPLTPIMAAPRIDTPVCRDLIALSPDLLLPGIAQLPAESVAALPTNMRFVESLMVGVNHEFGRELLWSGYPTDQRGTSLRRFWDRSASLNGATDDLPAIDHTWDGELGDHLVGGAGQVVLVIRGEVLQRYPRTAIYAAQARWVDGERQPVEPIAGADPTVRDFPQRYPAFSGSIPQDVTYVGFDLPDDPRGDPDPAAAKPGWFFVFQQPRTEVRLGLDATAADPPTGGVADLSWPAVGRSPSGHVDLTAPLTGVTLPGWGVTTNSAQLAAWCEQRPFRVCVHASDLLPVEGQP